MKAFSSWDPCPQQIPSILWSKGAILSALAKGGLESALISDDERLDQENN